MKKSELEKYLHSKVKVRLFNGDILTGVLYKTEECKHEIDFYTKQNYYVCLLDNGQADKNEIFRCSHVDLIKEAKWTTN